MKGLSLIEILLVILLISILFGFILSLSLDFYKNQQLETHTQGILQTLRRAQLKAMSVELGSSFGIHITNDSYILFQGNSFATRDGAFDEVFDLPQIITVSGISEIVFSKLDGIPSATGTITLSSGSETRTIGINAIGRIHLAVAPPPPPPPPPSLATLNNFTGFETGGLEEASKSTSGSPDVQNTTVRTGTYALKLAGAATQAVYRILAFENGIDSGDDFIVGFAFRTNNIRPSSSLQLIATVEIGLPMVLKLASNGDLVLYASGITEAGREPSLFIADKWHYVEIRWQNLDAGDADVYVDGIPKISVTGQDFRGSGFTSANNAVYSFLGSATVGEDIFIDDFYAYSGASGTSDFLGNAEVFRYQADTNSLTPDVGDDLDQGVWQDSGETPGVEQSNETVPKYTLGAGKNGTIFTDDTQSGENYRHGPHGDANIDGDSNIKGGKWLHQMKRQKGQPTIHYKRYGNDVDPITEVQVDLPTSYQNFFTVSEAATEVSLSTEHFAYGFRKGAGQQDLSVKEIWAFILHVPSP